MPQGPVRLLVASRSPAWSAGIVAFVSVPPLEADVAFTVDGVLALVLGTAAGLWADRTFGTDPWGMLAGFAMGFAAAVLNVVRITRRTLGSSR